MAANDTVVMSATDVFGTTPWAYPIINSPSGLVNWTGNDFATQQTAADVVEMIGGAIVPVNPFAATPGAVMSSNIPMLVVVLTSGVPVNPGQIANFFTHGDSLGQIREMIQEEIVNATAEFAKLHPELKIQLITDPSTVSVTMPQPTAAPPPVPAQLCGFGALENPANTGGVPTWTMTGLDGITGVQAQMVISLFDGRHGTDPNGKDSVASVRWLSPLAVPRGITGIWTEVVS